MPLCVEVIVAHGWCSRVCAYVVGDACRAGLLIMERVPGYSLDELRARRTALTGCALSFVGMMMLACVLAGVAE